MKVLNIILSMFVLFLLSCLNLSAETSDHIGNFKSVSGDVYIIRNGISATAYPGDYLLETDKIKTKEGTAGVIFIDGTLLSVGTGSDVDINVYTFKPSDEKYAFSLFMRKGTAMYSSGKLGKMSPESVNLETPRATIGIRGTRLILEVE